MKIKLKKIKDFNLTKDKAVILPFFINEKIEITKKSFKKEFEDFLYNLKIINNKGIISENFKDKEIELIVNKERKIIILNLGKKANLTERDFLLNIRKVIRFLKEKNIPSAVFLLDDLFQKKKDFKNLISEITENIILANYDFDIYKTNEKPKNVNLIEICFNKADKFKNELKRGKIIGKYLNFCRDLANTPGGEMTPKKLAKITLQSAKKISNIKLEILDEKKLKKLKMGGILGVSKGSKEKPRLIIIKYFGKKKENKNIDLVFVGKGVTFDSGGLSIKPAEAMTDMHLDMSGASAVISAIFAIAELRIPLNIVGLIPAVENMPSAQSYRPGDILKTYSGKTIEVLNTDAEGRIILADALSFGVKRFKPKLIIDVATLTGAAMIALGQRAIAAFTNNQFLEKRIREIGEKSGDYLWLLPCWKEYEQEVKGTFGDIRNIGKTKYGGAIVGAVFLKNFIESFPWIHLDIAPTMVSIENQGLSKGATGTGVRFLIKLSQNFKEISKNLKK